MKPLVTLFYLQPLFDVLARSNPPQVVLPFDSSATPKEISAHIRDAITRISMRVCKKKKIPHLLVFILLGLIFSDCFILCNLLIAVICILIKVQNFVLTFDNIMA